MTVREETLEIDVEALRTMLERDEPVAVLDIRDRGLAELEAGANRCAAA